MQRPKTDCFARSDDRASEVSRGHSRGMQAGKGLKALQVRKTERTDKPNRSPTRRPERSPVLNRVNGAVSKSENS